MEAFTIKSSDIARCPYRILTVEHYREDGTCKCTYRQDELDAVYDACLKDIREAAELARTGAFSEAAERCGSAAVLARRAAAMAPLVR